MTPLVTLAEVQQHLRIEGTADNAWIESIIPMVSMQISNWCGGDTRITDTNGDLLDTATLAALVQIAHLDANRGDTPVEDKAEWYGKGYVLCATATAILTPLRKPMVQ